MYVCLNIIKFKGIYCLYKLKTLFHWNAPIMLFASVVSVAQLVAYPLGTGRLWVRGSAVVPWLWVCSHSSALSWSSASMLVLGLDVRARPRRLDPNRVIAKDIKSCTYYCYVRYVTLIVRVGGNSLAPKNRRNSLPCTVRNSRQKRCN